MVLYLEKVKIQVCAQKPMKSATTPKTFSHRAYISVAYTTNSEATNYTLLNNILGRSKEPIAKQNNDITRVCRNTESHKRSLFYCLIIQETPMLHAFT